MHELPEGLRGKHFIDLALPGPQIPKLLIPRQPGTPKRLVRNRVTDRILPCSWDDCTENGDDRHQIQVPHPQPRWPGEKLVYIFCGNFHKRLYAEHNPHPIKV